MQKPHPGPDMDMEAMEAMEAMEDMVASEDMVVMAMDMEDMDTITVRDLLRLNLLQLLKPVPKPKPHLGLDMDTVADMEAMDMADMGDMADTVAMDMAMDMVMVLVTMDKAISPSMFSASKSTVELLDIVRNIVYK